MGEGQFVNICSGRKALPPRSNWASHCWLSEGWPQPGLLLAAIWRELYPDWENSWTSFWVICICGPTHIKELRLRGEVCKGSRWPGCAALRNKRQDFEESAGYWGLISFSRKMLPAVRADKKVVTLFAENAPTWFKLWVNSIVMKDSSVIS